MTSKIAKYNISMIFVPVFILGLLFVASPVSAQQITTPPTVMTTFANNIVVGTSANGNSAYLNGRVNPNGLQTVYWFEYGSTQNLGFKTVNKTISYNSQLSDVFDYAVGMPYGTNYYRIVAQSNAGVSYGGIVSFNIETYPTPSPGATGAYKQAPTVTTQTATQISPRSGSAYLNGRVNPNGQYTIAWFEYGYTPNLGYSTGEASVGSGRSSVDHQFFFLGAFEGTNYYRIVAKNESGITRGSITSFVVQAQEGSSVSGSSNLSGGSIQGNTNSSGTTSGGQYVFTGNTGTSSKNDDPSLFSTNSLGLGFAGSDGKNNFFSRVAGTSDVNENDPSLFVLFTKETFAGSDGLSAVVTPFNSQVTAGDDFTYVVVFRNDTNQPLQDVGFKITLPYQVQYVWSNIEPTETKNGFLSFDVQKLEAYEQKELIIETKLNSDIVDKSHLVFSSILTHKDIQGINRAITSYTVIDVAGIPGGQTDKSFLMALLGPLMIFSNAIWLGVLAMLVLAIFLIVRYSKNRTKILSVEPSQRISREKELSTQPFKKTNESSFPLNLPGMPAIEPVVPLRYKPTSQKNI